MKKGYILLILVSILFIFSSCGGMGGAPGSDSKDTGINITYAYLEGQDAGTNTDDEVDVAIHLCSGGEYEDGLFEHDAILHIGAQPTGFDDVFPANIDECKITYLKAEENPDAPIIEARTLRPNCVIKKGDNECTIPAGIMDIDRKNKFYNDLLGLNFDTKYPTHYVVQYKCTYINQYGAKGSFETEYDIYLADWDNC
ncbi:MAG: hypothetical protein Fur0020_05030 [Thermodesulfovibrionia bacterium]